MAWVGTRYRAASVLVLVIQGTENGVRRVWLCHVLCTSGAVQPPGAVQPEQTLILLSKDSGTWPICHFSRFLQVSATSFPGFPVQFHLLPATASKYPKCLTELNRSLR